MPPSATRLAGLVAALALSGCSDVSRQDLVVTPVWVAQDGGAARIAFAESGRFTATGLPATHFCAVEGRGTWQFEDDGNRVFLNFDSMSGGQCSAPYGMNLFRGHGPGLLAFRSVDEPATAIRFVPEPTRTGDR